MPDRECFEGDELLDLVTEEIKTGAWDDELLDRLAALASVPENPPPIKAKTWRLLDVARAGDSDAVRSLDAVAQNWRGEGYTVVILAGRTDAGKPCLRLYAKNKPDTPPREA